MPSIKKAQAATETLIVIAIALVVFLAIFVYNQQNISNVVTDFEVTKTKTALDSIANAANLVYQQGDGAKTKVYVNLPHSLKTVTAGNQTLTMILYGQSSEITLYKNFNFNLNGTIEISEGNQWIKIQSLGDNIFIGNFTISSESEESSSSDWQTIFFDDFTRPNSDLIGGNWTESGGKWDILWNKAHADNCDWPGDKITSNNINLTGKTNANLTFDWEYDNLDYGECLSLDLNDGTGWVEEVWIVCSSDWNQDNAGIEVIDLGNYISLTSTIQLRYDCLSSYYSDEVYIDNVNISSI